MNGIKKANIGIIGAMQIEVEALCAAMENTESETVGNMTFVYGDLRGKKVVCAKCGIGKVFAAMCAQTMILKYAPDCIINSGVAGTLSETLSIGQIALAEQVVQHDMDTSPIGDPVGLISGINIIYIPSDPAVTGALAAAVAGEGVPFEKGTIASGDQFICRSDVKARIKSNFEAEGKPVIACEMEGAAIGQVCYVNRVPYGILRAISDGGDEQAFADYPTFLAAAAKTATKVMLKFVENWS